MKKKINSWFVILVIAILFSITFIGCSEPDSDPTYTVWTDTISYSEFTSAFQTTLDDGYYGRLEFTDSDWAQISPSLTNEGKNNWTESQINKWFIGRGFGEKEANRETSWLMTINHGFLASRSGSLVYILLK